jgi:hypothetical protein
MSRLVLPPMRLQATPGALRPNPHILIKIGALASELAPAKTAGNLPG